MSKDLRGKATKMAPKIAVAGATGNLGKRIVRALHAQGADVLALARKGVAADKMSELQSLGAKVAIVDMSSASEIAKACAGAACVVSALQGLRDVIVDTQSVLLYAAIAAGVPRFIPSDYSVDFTKEPPGENRSFDLRREFHRHLDTAPVQSTAIFNGAFAEILAYNIPLLDYEKKMVGYWQDPDWRIDFTTMDDTAAFTAAAALDATTPGALHIASFSVSPNELVDFAAAVLKTPFQLVRLGSLEDLRAYNKRERAAHPEGEKELYPLWQRGQYTQSMFTTHHQSLDNNRYPQLKWAKLQDVIGQRPQSRPVRAN
jgi:nucleoside-diphosphate-sugar epimerase